MSTEPARVLVVEHQADCPPALMGGWLQDAGLHLDVLRPYADRPLPSSLDEYDALVVLGGSMDAFDDVVAWLEPTRALIREAVASAVPVLGICLGHQLAATALGGTVARNPRGQLVGLVELGRTAEALSDLLLGSVAGPGLFWNQDVVTVLPPDAVVLARSATGEVQAVRYADRAWGLQWHPEADAALLAEWARDDADSHRELGIDTSDVLARVEAARDLLEADGRRLADAFARQVLTVRTQ